MPVEVFFEGCGEGFAGTCNGIVRKLLGLHSGVNRKEDCDDENTAAAFEGNPGSL